MLKIVPTILEDSYFFLLWSE